MCGCFEADFGPAEPAGRRQTRPVEAEEHPYIHHTDLEVVLSNIAFYS